MIAFLFTLQTSSNARHGWQRVQAENTPDVPHSNQFDQYGTSTPLIASASHTPQPTINPYAQDSGPLGVPTYFQGQSNYSQPVNIASKASLSSWWNLLRSRKLQHHLYAAWGPSREPLQPNQRSARDLFIPEDLRQTLQKKTDATLATFPSKYDLELSEITIGQWLV